jgi:hypothetical protein
MSMTTIFAPRSLRAFTAWVITLTWVATALVPQITTQSDFAISRGSGPASRPGAHHIARPGQIGADGGKEAGIFLGVPQAVDRIALHQPHRAGIEIGPDGLRAVLFLRARQPLSATRSSAASQLASFHFLALGAGADQRLQSRSGWWMRSA